MRTARYNNYTILKIFLLVVVIVLGLFVYLKFVKAPLEHVAADDAWVTVDATCTADGYRYKVCTECGEHFDNETLRSTGHTPLAAVKEDEKPHTKTEGGSYESVIYCEDCGVEISRETVMVGGAHTVNVVEIKINVVDATCDTAGSYDTVEICEGCEHVFEDTKKSFEVEALGHNVQIKAENEVPNTCTENGSVDLVEYCANCGEEFSRNTQVFVATGHDYEIVETEGTCTQDETTSYTCRVCGHNYVDVHAVAPGHNYEWVLSHENGSFIVTGTCVECNDVIDPEFEDGYSVEIVKDEENSKDPDCSSGKDIYVATITYLEEKIATASIVFEYDPIGDHTMMTESGESVDYLTFALYDVNGIAYYNISTYGVVLLVHQEEGQSYKDAWNAAWDEDGFAVGLIKCSTCGEWIPVRVYNDLA